MTLNTGVENEDDKKSGKNYTEKELSDIVEKLVEKRLKKDPEPATVPAGMTAEQINSIVLTVAKAMKKDEDIDYANGITEEQMPKEDYNKDGIMFCHPSCGWVITDDERQGQRVLIPYKKRSIFFKYQSELRHGYGKFETLTALATYVSHSNKEIKWLREHTLYNVVFFENTNIASQQDVKKMQRLTEVMRTIGSFDLPTLLRYCDENEVPKSNDIPSMRQQVAFKIMEREGNQLAKKTEDMLSEAFKTKALLSSDAGKD